MSSICKCNSSIKYKIISFLEQNNTYYKEGELIDNIYNIIIKSSTSPSDNENIDESFIKMIIQNILEEMVDKDKTISLKKFDIEEDKEQEYYYMRINKEKINDLFFKEEKDNKENSGINNNLNEPKVTLKNDINATDTENINIINEKRNENIKKINELKKNIMYAKKKKEKEYLDILHQYNHYKDVAQELIGRMAILRNVPIKELYEEMDLDINEE